MVAKSRPTPKINKSFPSDPKWDGWDSWSLKEFNKKRLAMDTYYYDRQFGCKIKDFGPVVKEWMLKNEYSKKDVEAVLAAKANVQLNFIGKICRELMKGMPATYPEYDRFLEKKPAYEGQKINNDYVDVVKENLTQLIDVGQHALIIRDEERKQQEKLQDAPKITIQQRTEEIAYHMMDDFEQIIDNIMKNIEEVDFSLINPLSILRKHEAKPTHARIIKDFYEPELHEIEELLGPKPKFDTDDEKDMYEQLVEGYDHLSKIEKKNIYEFLKAIIEGCDMVIDAGKATRKSRKPKSVSKEKLLARIKYQQEESSIGVVSISPVDILNTSEVWIYNTKSRKIGKFIALKGGSGISVKGTTLTGFDEKESSQKTLRKPKEQLGEFKTLTKAKAKKWFNEIKAVEQSLKGRLNDTTILLKAVK